MTNSNRLQSIRRFSFALTISRPDDIAESGDAGELVEDLIRLETSLVDQDSKIWSLSQGIGGLDQRLRDLEQPGGSAAAGGLRERLAYAARAFTGVFSPSAKDRTTVDADDLAPGVPAPHPSLVPFGEENAIKPVIAVTIFGLSVEETTQVLDTVESRFQKRDAVPIILTDSNRFETMRERGMAFEYFPPENGQGRPAPDGRSLYFQRRLSLLRKKWGPTDVISFGAPGPIAAIREILLGEDEPA